MPVPPEDAARYDIAFLDLLGDPAQLGGLRARGLVTADTITAVAFADHRVPVGAANSSGAAGSGGWACQLTGMRSRTDRSAERA